MPRICLIIIDNKTILINKKDTKWIKKKKATITKKHFINIAKIINENKPSDYTSPLGQKMGLINNLSIYFKSENKNFDQDKFKSACLGGQ